MAAALLAYDAKIATDQRRALEHRALARRRLGGAADNALEPGEIIEASGSPPPLAGERAALQARDRPRHAEWPLVEVAARACRAAARFSFVRLSAGGVAPVPLRLSAAEAAGRARPSRIDHRACGPAHDRRRLAPADDRLQARADSGPDPRLSGAVFELAASGWNRHREERSDAAIQEPSLRPSSPGLLRFRFAMTRGSPNCIML